MAATTDWVKAIQPLLKKYKGMKHPLEYKNTYQLVVMVILAAQDSDKHINEMTPELLKEIPNMKVLAKHTADTLIPRVKKIRNHRNKANWLLKIAQQVKTDANIPKTMDELVALPG